MVIQRHAYFKKKRTHLFAHQTEQMVTHNLTANLSRATQKGFPAKKRCSIASARSGW